MKKSKLVLQRETLRQLSGATLVRVHGGSQIETHSETGPGMCGFTFDLPCGGTGDPTIGCPRTDEATRCVCEI